MNKELTLTPFKLLIRVRYVECDAQGVVFNARYADYADLAATEFMRATLGGYQYLLEQGLDTQVVNLSINWKSSAKFDDIIRLETLVSKVGNTSFTLGINLFEHNTDRHVATCEVVYVMVSTSNFQKTPISDALKQKMQTTQNKLIDMTGTQNQPLV